MNDTHHHGQTYSFYKKYRALSLILICILGFTLNFDNKNTFSLWQTAQAQLITSTDSLTVDTSDIKASRAIFYNVFDPAQEIEIAWNGDHTSCDPGHEDPILRDILLQRVNYYRAMAGVPANVTFSEEYNEKAQQAALAMSANNNLSHGITPDWECYTEDADEASRNSNLALYYNQDIWDFVSLYIQDTSNYYVGHRRWMLHPNTQVMGSGTVPQTGEYRATNALWIVDMDNLLQPRPQTRENFIAWPPAGYVPYQVTYALWSFSYPGADYSAATITMLENGTEIPVEVEQEYQMSILDNTLVWLPNGMGPDETWSPQEEETVYSVTLHDVMVDGTLRDFTYEVILFDPLLAPPQPTATPTDVPTDTPEPTATLVPTDTPVPTDTATPTLAPTYTPEPTATPSEASDESTTDMSDPADDIEEEGDPSSAEMDRVDQEVSADEVHQDGDHQGEEGADATEGTASDEAEEVEESAEEPATDENSSEIADSPSGTELDTEDESASQIADDVESESISEGLQEEDEALVADIDTDLAPEDTQDVDDVESESLSEGLQEKDEALITDIDIDLAPEDTQDADDVIDEIDEPDMSEALEDENTALDTDDVTVGTATETEIADLSVSEPSEQNEEMESGTDDMPESTEDANSTTQGNDVDMSEPSDQNSDEAQQADETATDDEELNSDSADMNNIDGDESLASDETATDENENNVIRSETDEAVADEAVIEENIAEETAIEDDIAEESVDNEIASDDTQPEEDSTESLAGELLRRLFLPFITK